MMASMALVHQRKRLLGERPGSISAPALRLRHYRDDEDIGTWLELRQRAFARQPLGVRQWDEQDFRREFLEKPWWRPDWMWFAESHSDDKPQCVGTVTMALRQSSASTIPVVHWLSVAPQWRCRGVGRLLMNALEQAAWDAGFREVALETHAAWREAQGFYDALGYHVVKTDPAT
jgi:GNAT superfamily N-acetyltransferase